MFSYFPNIVILINNRQIINYLNKNALIYKVSRFCELEIAQGPLGPEGDKVASRTPGANGDKGDPGIPAQIQVMIQNYNMKSV